MSKVVHFEINADDPERAAKFYTEAFGWEINKWDGPMDYWLAKTGEMDQMGISGAIMKRMKPGISVINTIGVGNIDEALEKVTSSGGLVVSPKTEIPGVGIFAYCKDTEGNMFGVIEPKMP